MKKHWKSITLLVVLMTLLVLSEVYAPKKIDWSPTFSLHHKKPFGAYALFKMLEDIFPEQNIKAVHVPASEALSIDEYYKSSKLDELYNYISLNRTAQFNEIEVEYLLDFVGEGNSVFIAAEYFMSPTLTDTLGFDADFKFSFQKDLMNFEEDSVTISFSNPKLKGKRSYRFRKSHVENYFTEFDTTTAIILGTNDDNKANFIKMPFGKGDIYISTVPMAFTNYHLLYGNHGYIEKAFSYLPQQNIIWDEYYKVGRQEAQTPLRVILTHEALRWAYIIAIIFLLLYIIFEGKRKQRIIPVIPPLKNTTVEFTEIVGRLYFHKKDHRDLLEKKRKYFMEHIRTTYYLNTNELDDEFFTHLSSKTGIERSELRNIFTTLREALVKNQITETELHKCNELIESFYRKTNK